MKFTFNQGRFPTGSVRSQTSGTYSGKLNDYLADIDRQAEKMFERPVKQMAESEGVTEQLKNADQIAWVGKMNNIRNRAEKIVTAEWIYT